MDRIWRWVWDRFGASYSWAFFAITFTLLLSIYLLWSFLVVDFEGSRNYAQATALTVVAVMVLAYLTVLPGRAWSRLAEQWAAGHAIDRAKAVEDTYAWSRSAPVRAVTVNAVGGALMLVAVGAIGGASPWRLAQYGILGAVVGICAQLIAVHSYAESALRPVRAALTGHLAIGDSLPRSRPSFAAWTKVSVLATALLFTLSGAMLAAVIHQTNELPLLSLAIGAAMTAVFGVPIGVGAMLSPSLLPIRDLAEGTERVAAGDYSERVPVVQDDDLGALTASFNRMQAGLAERQRLQAAFGTYVDPALAARLLEQGDDVFTGERREVTVMFVDVRDFTPFAEANAAEDTVARLNALFDIVVPAVIEAGGHVNKFLGDGALAVFGAPNDLAEHADAAVSSAVLIHGLVAERFSGTLRIGTGINTGTVIAGTIGGGGKLEFTLIGDTVNVASRVEQLTKTTGDEILLTQQCVHALAVRPPGLVDRGSHALKGKSAAVQVFGLNQQTVARADR
jgi:adenylate cyclase